MNQHRVNRCIYMQKVNDKPEDNAAPANRSQLTDTSSCAQSLTLTSQD